MREYFVIDPFRVFEFFLAIFFHMLATTGEA